MILIQFGLFLQCLSSHYRPLYPWEGKTFQVPSMMQMAKNEGMQLLDQSIMEFLMQNIISPEEAHMKANDKKTFERFLKPH